MRVLRARRIVWRLLSQPSKLARYLLKRVVWVGSPTSHVERPQFHRGRSVSTAIMLPPSLLAISGGSATWSILDCARPTRVVFLDRALREREDDQAALPKSFAPRSSAESSPISAEPPLPGSPILSLLNSSIGMPKVWAGDPPEEREGHNAGEESEPETQAFGMCVRDATDTHILCGRGQRHHATIETFPKTP